ncbi:hypothetical protein TVAG_021560 [Trichomonas vaginalis G3]|uniref:Uncharacterized protein n=1 Tax=Trichomonas vaginalis (strain ATCC PRA-98 / G3) TaxID=412133 RepID=A2DHD6_TRIV3|nr:hypothetical protein TVAGG3_0678270 [Trichomonas vaginalis G3]EAY20209.1 hypothetical protein TVAG_021560 [Trichomonas vaginalis G3]KAI5507704.1 hypothetical protein TVAGG3_0678270 [Trichomonas vaginalis G3]|eukprot:XP_001581195.1 hypothetical protein [Trichomonas vaginalis G3]
MSDENLWKYDKLFAIMRGYINEKQANGDNETNDQIGRIAALIFEIEQEFLPNKKKDLTRDQRHIITMYCPRHSRENEQKRKDNYIGDTNYKELESYKLILELNNNKVPQDTFIRKLIELMKETDNLDIPREAKRSKEAHYKFLNEHIDILRELIENGLKFEYN